MFGASDSVLLLTFARLTNYYIIIIIIIIKTKYVCCLAFHGVKILTYSQCYY